MFTEQRLPISSLQPELEEFLSALDGFLSKQAAPTDPSHLRFLEIFFRSVKSEKGHLLRVTELETLRSVVSYGIGANFDEDFNAAHDAHFREPSPLDVAFQNRDAVAIVDINKTPDVPKWFLDIMKKYGFVSLVAVPLMGGEKPIGILCAYYHDVCLFDRGTLGHLMMIGKMVGQATEKSRVADRVQVQGEIDRSADQFLKFLLGRSLSKTQIYSSLAKYASEAVPTTGLVCGSVLRTNRGLILTVEGCSGLPSSALSSQILLPPFVSMKFSSGLGLTKSVPRALPDWAAMQGVVNLDASFDSCHPLIWRDTLEGALLAWRPSHQSFDTEDHRLLSRLSNLTSLALHTIH